MENVDKYYIAPISVLTKIEYLGDEQYNLTSNIFKYACVCRTIHDDYLDFLSNETYYQNARYFHKVGRVFVNLSGETKLIPLSQITNKKKISKGKLKKLVREYLIEFNKRFLSQQDLDTIGNIDSEQKVKTLQCGKQVLCYTENKNYK